MRDLLLILSALLAPFVPPAWGIAPRRAGRSSTLRSARPGKHRRLNPVQAAAADAALARVVTAGPQYGGHTLQLPCKGCGTRAVPPVDYIDSPLIPFERAALVPLARGYVITAMCTACDSPLISRVLDDEHADYARQLGAIDGEAAEADLARDLAAL